MPLKPFYCNGDDEDPCDTDPFSEECNPGGGDDEGGGGDNGGGDDGGGPPPCYDCPPPAVVIDSTQSIVNNMTNACLNGVFSKILGGHSQFSTMLKQLGADPNINFVFTEAPSFDDAGQPVFAKTRTYGSGQYKTFEIKFNLSRIHNSAQEFLAETILHEIMHAFMDSKNPNLSELEQHQNMYTQGYIDLEITALQNMFPSLSNAAATKLVIGGYDDIKENNRVLYDQILAARNVTEIDVQNTNNDYRHGATGTKCQ